MVTPKDSGQIKIAFCGEITLGAEVAQHMGSAPVNAWLQGVSKAWEGADLLIGNLESPCVRSASPVFGPLPELIFRAPASRLTELATVGFSMLTLANNHIMDCGAIGLLETIEALDEAGIYHAGAGRNLAEALQPAFVTVKNITVGLVSFCYGPPAGRSSPGAAFYDHKLMRKTLKAARTEADLVIAALHDGLEYSDVPPLTTRNRLRFLAENGADIVVGHHPHVLQGLEWHNSVPIAYSLGDFLFHNSLPSVTTRNFSRIALARYAPEEITRDPEKFRRGAVLVVRIRGKKLSAEWHPFRQDSNLRPHLCSGQLKLEDLRRLDELSRALSNPTDPRHGFADSVMAAVEKETLKNLGIKDVLSLARRPKWRYAVKGLEWLYQRLQPRC